MYSHKARALTLCKQESTENHVFVFRVLMISNWQEAPDFPGAG